MGSPDLLFGVCLIIGIVMVFLGVLFIALCEPLASGRVRSRDYNYRPLSLAKITLDERDMADRKASKWVIVWAVFVIVMGLGAIWIGLIKNSGPFNLSTDLMLLAHDYYSRVKRLYSVDYSHDIKLHVPGYIIV